MALIHVSPRGYAGGTSTGVGGSAILTVRDEGIGIPANDQRRIFEAFHRGGNVGSVAGTGLGLVIVRRSCELHGGSITFHSAEGRGTTFTVTLPSFPPKNPFYENPHPHH